MTATTWCKFTASLMVRNGDKILYSHVHAVRDGDVNSSGIRKQPYTHKSSPMTHVSNDLT